MLLRTILVKEYINSMREHSKSLVNVWLLK